MKRLLWVLIMFFAISGIAMAAVNINTATKEELISLKGIGEKRAQDIIDHRTKNGPFKTVDDLEKVPGIGPGIMKQIRGELTTTGKTTIDKPAAATKTKAVDAKATKSADTKATKTADTKATKAAETKVTKAVDTKVPKVSDTTKTEPAKGDAAKAEKKTTVATDKKAETKTVSPTDTKDEKKTTK